MGWRKDHRGAADVPTFGAKGYVLFMKQRKIAGKINDCGRVEALGWGMDRRVQTAEKTEKAARFRV